ncbi:hypothetical protein [Actinomadura sp. CNU-125]|uniref:hypothetical protein n=1 Tax=Actinomadura sp. CNU-125 TaxID=1904961 RepID=UPI0039673CDE
MRAGSSPQISRCASSGNSAICHGWTPTTAVTQPAAGAARPTSTIASRNSASGVSAPPQRAGCRARSTPVARSSFQAASVSLRCRAPAASSAARTGAAARTASTMDMRSPNVM